MTNIYELYGRLMEERQREHEQHLRTIALLAALKAGVARIEDVEVWADGWKHEPKAAEANGETG